MKGKSGRRDFSPKKRKVEQPKFKHRFETQIVWVFKVFLLSLLIIFLASDGAVQNEAGLIVLFLFFIIYTALILLAGVIDKEFYFDIGGKVATLKEHPVVYIISIASGVFIILLFSLAILAAFTGSWPWCDC